MSKSKKKKKKRVWKKRMRTSEVCIQAQPDPAVERERKFRDDIMYQLNYWKKRLLLQEWQIQVEFKDTPHKNDDHSSTCPCEIVANPVYLEAKVLVYPLLREKNAHDLTTVLVHELAHCLTQSVLNVMDSMRAGVTYHKHHISDEVELLTQRIANVALIERWVGHGTVPPSPMR